MTDLPSITRDGKLKIIYHSDFLVTKPSFFSAPPEMLTIPWSEIEVWDCLGEEGDYVRSITYDVDWPNPRAEVGRLRSHLDVGIFYFGPVLASPHWEDMRWVEKEAHELVRVIRNLEPPPLS